MERDYLKEMIMLGRESLNSAGMTSRIYALETNLRMARSEAEAAWSKKDYAGVTKALKPLRASLTATEVMKLEFAEKHLCQMSKLDEQLRHLKTILSKKQQGYVAEAENCLAEILSHLNLGSINGLLRMFDESAPDELMFSIVHAIETVG